MIINNSGPNRGGITWRNDLHDVYRSGTPYGHSIPCVLQENFANSTSYRIWLANFIVHKDAVQFHLLLIICFPGYAGYLMIAHFQPGWDCTFVGTYRAHISEHHSSEQMCSIIAPFHGRAAGLFVGNLLLVNVATIIIYTIAAISIARKTDGEKDKY